MNWRVMFRALLTCLFVLCSHMALGRSSSQSMSSAADSCPPAIAAAELQNRLPPKLLGAIAMVESGRPDPVSGRATPWPWTINAGGIGHFYSSKADAISAARAFQALGVRSIDVGCMQINLFFHPGAFVSLDEAFDPAANAAYGARFLGELHRQLDGWPQAAAAYHSQTPQLGQDYEDKVMAIWPLASRYPDMRVRVSRLAEFAPDYSKYTPEFALRVRQMVEDRAHLAARFGNVVGGGSPGDGGTTQARASGRHRTRPIEVTGQDVWNRPLRVSSRPSG